MKKYLTTSEIKDIEVEILDYVVSICEKNQIEYVLAYGTLLGAVRHKGFIPWDDDIDIVLLRDEYERLLRCIDDDNNERFRLLKPLDKGYILTFSKVIDVETKIVEENGVVLDDNRGIFIDLFPLDNLNSYSGLKKLGIELLLFLYILSCSKKLPHSRHLGVFVIFPWLYARIWGNRYWVKKICNFSKKCNEIKSDNVTFPLENNVYPKEMFKAFSMVEFEGKKYQAPLNYDSYLRITYGDDYMQLPPEEKRITHKIKAIRLK